jgi:L-ribulose-5-phosphate 3-epimerase
MADTSAFAAAKELGADGVQVDFGAVDDNLPVLYNKELQESYPVVVGKSKLEIASFALGALSWAPYKNDDRGQQWISDGIDVCKTMRVGVILLPFFGGADLAEDAAGRRTVADKLKRIAPKAEKAGVVLDLES